MFTLKIRMYATEKGLTAVFAANFKEGLPNDKAAVLGITQAAGIAQDLAQNQNTIMMAVLKMACEGVTLTNKIQLEMDRDPRFLLGSSQWHLLW